MRGISRGTWWARLGEEGVELRVEFFDDLLAQLEVQLLGALEVQLRTELWPV